MNKQMTGITFLIAIVIFLVFLTFVTALQGQHFLLFSFICLIASVIPFYWKFESSALKAREVVFLAVLIAIAAVSRVPFAIIPNVQPTSFVIITAGAVLGPESGFIIGSTVALTSNMFLGQGPWTPWQMFAWGMMGMTAGLLKNTPLVNHKYAMVLFGFVWGFVFGWIMDLWYLVAYINPLNFKAMLLTFLGTGYFDLLHALSNVFFSLIFYNSWKKTITRFKIKYGLLD
ncbi:ECF transporter S component [Pediococcus acidilactici]|uniref:ECF transporter S component n=1 Tax=Pediococcus acidilactici TaxID=1254 RepID=UPI001C9A8D6D|nr:ECF transporter S component [Pediococcus acidilactici]